MKNLFRFLILLTIIQGQFAVSSAQPVNAAKKITLGIQVATMSTLVMVAKDKGFFANEGLDVDLKLFTAGTFALQALLSHSLDYAVSGEVPVCLASLQGNDIRVIAQVVEKTKNEVRVVARRDNDFTSPELYFKAKKRKLATPFGGGPEFFTYNFLKRNHISDNQIEILSQRPEDMPAALETGSVDAIVLFDPLAFIAEDRMGRQAITFTNASGYSELNVLNALPDKITNDGPTIEAMLRALKNASQFIAVHPEEAKQILQQYTKLNRDVINHIWGNFSFKPALTKNLLRFWKLEAQWAKDTHKILPDTPIPHFRNMIEPSFLRRIDPDAVKV